MTGRRKEASKVAEIELHRSRWWAYKWLNRFDNHGLEGLKDKPRSGSRPPLISEKKMLYHLAYMFKLY